MKRIFYILLVLSFCTPQKVGLSLMVPGPAAAPWIDTLGTTVIDTVVRKSRSLRKDTVISNHVTDSLLQALHSTVDAQKQVLEQDKRVLGKLNTTTK